MDVTALHATLCGQAAVSAMLSVSVPTQRAAMLVSRNSYLHAARLLMEFDGASDHEARETTAAVYTERLADHEKGWVCDDQA